MVYIMCAHKNRLDEAILMRSHNISSCLSKSKRYLLCPLAWLYEKYTLAQITPDAMDGWMTCDFTSFFNSISVISGRCSDDNERLCAMEHRLR